jgi:cell division protease FtsH
MEYDAKINSALKFKSLLKEDSYNKLVEKIDKHEVSKIYFSNTLNSVISENKEENGEIIEDFSVTKINPFLTNSLSDLSIKNNVQAIFLQDPTPSTGDFLLRGAFGFFESYIFPFLFITFIITLFQNRAGSGGMPGMPGFAQPKSINSDKLTVQKANITLNSFAGSPEIFEECTEVVSYLKNDTLYKEAGAEIPRGILLDGPPGTGKTLLAKAIASEADANFISVAASEFVELFVGMGAAKIRNLFKNARENTPCIIFIDEIDAVGRQRGAGINMANDEREQTLNQLLAEMDGFADNEGVLIIAATNRKDVLDSALLRPGRFDRLITVPLPDREAREQIFKVHSKNKKFDQSVDLNTLAELTPGFSGAQIKNLMNEAAIFAAKNGSSVIKQVNVLNALDKAIVGLEKRNDTRSVESKLRVSIHEAGHAVLAALYVEYFELKKVTIQSTYNGAGGYTLFNELQNITESGLYTKDLLKKRLIIAMGGKAAENIFYGEEHVSVGAVQDLKQANSLAQRMIGNYGMGSKLEVFYNENIDSERNPFLGRSLSGGQKYSEKIKEMADKEALELVNDAYQEAKEILIQNKKCVDEIVAFLLHERTLYGEKVYEIIDPKRIY